jgi:hypothetical protein
MMAGFLVCQNYIISYHFSNKIDDEINMEEERFILAQVSEVSDQEYLDLMLL